MFGILLWATEQVLKMGKEGEQHFCFPLSTRGQGGAQQALWVSVFQTNSECRMAAAPVLSLLPPCPGIWGSAPFCFFSVLPDVTCFGFTPSPSLRPLWAMASLPLQNVTPCPVPICLLWTLSQTQLVARLFDDSDGRLVAMVLNTTSYLCLQVLHSPEKDLQLVK